MVLLPVRITSFFAHPALIIFAGFSLISPVIFAMAEEERESTDEPSARDDAEEDRSSASINRHSLEDRLAHEELKFELRRIEKTFVSIDELFAQAVVKFQSISVNDALGTESISRLSEFMSLPDQLPAIILIIEKCLARKLTGDEIEVLKQVEKPTLPKAVRVLWQHKLISDKKSQFIILNNAPISSQELIRLVENGVVRTSKGFYVQLRTGDNFGDTLKLFETVSRAIKKVKDSPDTEIANLPATHLFTHPMRPEVVEAFGSPVLTVHDIINDANVIRQMRRHFLFVSSIGMPIRFRPGTVNMNPGDLGGFASVNPVSSAALIVTPKTLSAVFVGNYYYSDSASAVSSSLMVNPMGITYTGSYNVDGRGADWWLSYSSGYLGGGANYTVNFDKGTSWSNGQPSFLAFGAMAAGWRNNLMMGFSISTLLANRIGIGASAQMSITRSHDITYLGEYPLDGIFSAIRGLHKIQIDDTIGVSGTATLGMNFSAAQIPITVAFRVGADFTRSRIYRTHVDLGKTQHMLSEADVPGVLYLLGKNIKETRIPKFEDPEILIDGDELVETKIGRLTGAFVIGLESLVQISAARIGGSVELIAEFELGLRRLPNDKFEVSIEPKRVYQMGLFGSMLNIFGAGHVTSMAIARKQIFIFDFTEREARRAYFDLVHHGRLPTSEDIEIYSEDRGPEYLLTEFRAQNESLAPRGIARTYLEKIRIATSKMHIGLNVPLISAGLDIINKIDEKARKHKERLNLHFEGIDRECVRSHAKSVATNGLISVRKSVFGGRKSEGQGFSGRYNQDIFVTHRRIHAIDDTPSEFAGNKWQFDSLLVHFQLEDTKITGNEENEMAEKIDQLFSTFIGSFNQKNSNALRIINIEREFSKRDLAELIHHDCRDRVSTASQTTGISQQELHFLLKSLKNKHADHQGLLLKEFIETNSGATGFAAIHQLLGAKPEHLIIRTESGYNNAVLEAKKFIASFSKPDATEPGPVVNLVPIRTKKHRKHAREFYTQASNHLREIDNQLRLLYDDKYLLDDESPLVRIYGKAKVRELIEKGIRQDKTSVKSPLISARKTILEILDLVGQNFSQPERIAIYDMAGKKRLRLNERIELMLSEFEPHPIDTSMDRGYLKKRLEKTWDTIAKIDNLISELENDRVMEIMDPEYVDNFHHELSEMRRRLAESAAIDHLDQMAIETIKTELQTKDTFQKLFHRGRPTNFLIDGALATTYHGSPNSAVSTRDYQDKIPPGFEDDEADQDVKGRIKRVKRLRKKYAKRASVRMTLSDLSKAQNLASQFPEKDQKKRMGFGTESTPGSMSNAWGHVQDIVSGQDRYY